MLITAIEAKAFANSDDHENNLRQRNITVHKFSFLFIHRARDVMMMIMMMTMITAAAAAAATTTKIQTFIRRTLNINI